MSVGHLAELSNQKQLVKRTLTNLYNERPAWLDMAHRKLDEAVFAAYGWQPNVSDEMFFLRAFWHSIRSTLRERLR